MTDANQTPTAREAWERERLLESLDAYKRGLADAPIVQRPW